MSKPWVDKTASIVFGNRAFIIALFAIATLFLGYKAASLKPDAGFEKRLPLKHPYIQTFTKYQREFGGANRLLVAVRAKQGDMFTPEFFGTLKKVTDEVFYLPGVNRGTLRSLFTPNVRFIEIVEGGFAGGDVIPATFKPTLEGLAQVRKNIIKSGEVGRLVANDFSAALVSAQLTEKDPTSGEKLDYLKVAKLLETKIRNKFQSEQIDIHIIGFAKVMGDVAEGAHGVLLFFALAFVITAGVVYYFTRSIIHTLMPLLCSVVGVVWNIGLLTLFGYGIDPMSILVPFLVFAIGVSHGVQMVSMTATGAIEGVESKDAEQYAFKRLLIPGIVALVSDTVGFLSILLIEIRIIQELAITASIGVLVLILTNLFLLPLILSYCKLPTEFKAKLLKRVERKRQFWKKFGVLGERKVAIYIIVLAVCLLVFGVIKGQDLRIGDVQRGVATLRPDSRYNQDTARIVDSFSIGVDTITTLVKTIPDGCVQHDVMSRIDEFAWRISNVEGVQSTITLAQVAKIINAGWNEGNPKWRVVPRNTSTLVQAVSSVETSTGLLNADCSVMPVMIFTEDHKAETINRVVAAVEAFAAKHNSERHTFMLATGNVGVMAATNEVVEDSQLSMLLYVYGAVFLLCLVTFRSLRGTLCVVLPLTVVSSLCYPLMSWLGIGLKVSTLPVAALGVGIGVDYGIYIYSRLSMLLERGLPLREALEQTLEVTGNAVLITGLTLSAGVATWLFSDLQFQADMGVLLVFMFLGNMVGALVLLPALVYFLHSRKITAE